MLTECFSVYRIELTACGQGTISVPELSNNYKSDEGVDDTTVKGVDDTSEKGVRDPVIDTTLVLLSKGGDTGAYESLVRKYEKKMYNVALRITGNAEDAAEAAQDAFVSAYRRLQGFKGDARFSTWLYRITVNASLNRVKAAKKEPVSLDDCPEPDSGGAGGGGGDGGTALEQMETKELQQAVQRCIGRLDPGFREVVVLRDIQGLSYDEVAETLGIKAGTVRSRLSRARESLRECLKGVIDEV